MSATKRPIEQSDFAYTEAEWRKIELTLPARAKCEERIFARRELEAAAGWYLQKLHGHRSYKQNHPALVKTIQLIDAAILNAEKAGHDAVLPDLKNALARAKLPLILVGFGRRNVGKTPIEVASLYEFVLSIWTHLGGNLGLSRSPKTSKPTGPTIKYLTTALSPILKDKLPKPEGLASIIKRTRPRRDSYLGNGTYVLKKYPKAPFWR